MRETSPYLSIVIPVYNEENRIGDTLAKVAAYLAGQPYRAEVVVVDDGSTDATADIVRGAAAGSTGVRLLSIDHAGKGWAVRRGMLAAAGDYRLFCDADLSVPIEQIERLLPPIAPDVDIAIGSREAPGAVRPEEPWQRHLMGRIFNALVRRLVVADLGDTQCGFKCFKRGAVDDLFGLQTTGGFAFDVEILYLARRQGLTIAEIGVDWHYGDRSKVNPARDSLLMTRDVLLMRCRHRGGRAGRRDDRRG
ncbi:MAG: glycosyltransferase family 2 protein [Acidobacteria bacterium]|nr:glycosyltransferase family 2 protein [Acidobacteriota bacterium]